jgi:hypothetical protein
MSANIATITINFAKGAATVNEVVVSLTNSSVSLSQDYGASVAMASAMTNITVLANQVTFATAYNAQFNGTMQMQITWTTGQEPAVTLDNLQNAPGSAATVTWPTATQPVTQYLSPGVAMPLTGIFSQ